MRILHILDHGLPLQSGYTFRTRAILKAQGARGHEVAAVTGPRQGQTGAAVEVLDGLTFHRSAGKSGGLLGELLAFSRRIGVAVDAFQPDVLHAHSPVLGALAAMGARTGLPLVYEIRAFWEDAAVGNATGREGSLRYRATKAVETWVAGRADAVAVICEGLRGDLALRGIPGDKIVVSPNGVDMGVFGTPPAREQALAAELGLEGADVIGFIGSFYPYEGLDDLLAAMPALVAARPNAALLLVGGGPAEAELRAAAADSLVADRIRFVGRVPHAEVERYYGLIDVLAYPRKAMRLTELVTPLKPLEAMAQGRLVAASDVGGHRELIEDGVTGTLFRAGDPAGIAQSLTALLADRSQWELRRASARAFVERERNWSSNIGRYDPVYQRLIDAARRKTRWFASTANA